MKGETNRFGRRLENQLLTENQAAIGIIAAVIIMVVAIGLILVIVANIVPLIIFLVLAIVFALIMKHFIFGGRSLGITKGIFGVTRAVGKEFVPVAKQAGGMLGRIIGR